MLTISECHLDVLWCFQIFLPAIYTDETVVFNFNDTTRARNVSWNATTVLPSLESTGPMIQGSEVRASPVAANILYADWYQTMRYGRFIYS